MVGTENMTKEKTETAALRSKTYAAFRKRQWALQPKDVDFAGIGPGNPPKMPLLQPKPILFYKDVWHCPDAASAKRLVGFLVQYEDIVYIECETRNVRVDFNTEPGGTHVLPGQKTDMRKQYRGR